MPERIQRQRTKGWRAPAGAVYVGRGSEWGNPFTVGVTIRVDVPPAGQAYAFTEALLVTPRLAVDLYRAWLLDSPLRVQDARLVLAGRVVMCWCPPGDPCHGDVLLELANEMAPGYG